MFNCPNEPIANKFQNILDARNCSIEINEINYRYEIEADPDADAEWNVRFSGYPHPKLVWYDNNLNEITKGSQKFDVKISKDITMFKIRRLQLNDTGEYTLRAHNQIEDVQKKFQLLVRGGFC